MTSHPLQSRRRRIVAPFIHALLAVVTVGGSSPASAQETEPAAPVSTDGGITWPLDDEPSLRALAARHGLRIGNAMRYEWRDLSQIDPDVYETIIAREFDIVTPESSLKWDFVHPFENQYDFADMDRLVEFAERNDQAVHGHPLVWHRLNPQWLETLEPAQVEAAMVEHIATVVGRYRGRVAVWDVIIEALDQFGTGAYQSSVFLEAMGPS